MSYKKAICIFLTGLVLLTALSLAACKQQAPEPTQTTPTVTQAPETEPQSTDPIPVDYDNGVMRKPYTVEKILLENDFSAELDPTVVEEYHKSSWYGSDAALEDGWLHLTSSEHLFVFGTHTWGAYGGIRFEVGKTYTLSFDLKRGVEYGNNAFTLTLAQEAEGQDPRFGDQLKQVVIDFANYGDMVAFNSDKGSFAAVTYDAETGIAHVEVQFTVDRGGNNCLVNCRDAGAYNDWYLDNLYIAQIAVENSDFQWIVDDTSPTYDYSLNSGWGYTVNKVLLNEKFNYASSMNLKNGGREALWGPTKKSVDNGMARLSTNQHIFTFGRFRNWDNFGGVEFQKDHTYVMSFDLKLGDARTQKVFNLYLMRESAEDPRFGTPLKTLTLDFSDLYRPENEGEENYFVKENTGGFASVKYDSKTRIASVKVKFKCDRAGLVVVSKGTGDNEWLLDNIYIADATPPVNVTKYDYDNGVTFEDYEEKACLFVNDFAEELNKGVTQQWHKSAFYGSAAALENGTARLTSKEHLFVWGKHSWGLYGGVEFVKGATYKMSFDLQLGENNANRNFELLVATENGDPRYGKAVKTLTLNFMDFRKLVTKNTDDFASVTYSKDSDWAHIEILFTADSKDNTLIVSRSRGDNNWLIDNVQIWEMRRICTGHVDQNGDNLCDICDRTVYIERDYDNGVTFENYQAVETVLENDFAETVDKGVTEAWHKSSFYGSTAVVEDGWSHVTSSEHVFVFGKHTWGLYGGVSFTPDSCYQVSFDLKLGDEDAQRQFNLLVTTEKGDPRYGTAYETLTLNFADYVNFVAENTHDFASVTYSAETHTAHITVVFKADSAANTLLVVRQEGVNNWYLDNLLIQKVQYVCPGHEDADSDSICDLCGTEIIDDTPKDYDNGISFADKTVESVLFENDFAETADKGVTQAWHKSSFYGSAAAVEDGWVRLTSAEHLFVYGRHSWGLYGGVDMEKNAEYKVSFDLKLGAEDANKTFNLYVMSENGDPRFGTAVKTLTLNFADTGNLVTVNTDDFASVVYKAETGIAHIEVVFTTDAAKNTQLVSRCTGANNWLADNLKFEKIIKTQEVTDYDNGISFDGYTVESTLLQNDFSESVDKNAARTGFWGCTATLEDGWLRLKSTEHIFVFGRHLWGIFGGADMAKNTTYKVSFDLKLGAEDANKVFNLYVMQDAGNDPRFGTVVKTLTLNFADIASLVTDNTDNFASVFYDSETGIAHIQVLFTTHATVNTELVSKCNGTNNWLLDDLKFEKVVAP